jgi:hypothetical protein
MEPQIVDEIDNTKVPSKAILGTPWYNILSNPRYAEDFAYIGAHIAKREMYIVDNDDNDDNNCEQSDIVMILLNLSAIPDDVA